MAGFDFTNLERVLGGSGEWIAPELARTLTDHPLDCITTEFPHHMHPAESSDDITRPRADHPVFYGCFDWHSAVHSHWCLVRQLRLLVDHPLETDIVAAIDGNLTEAGVVQEVAYLEANESFEKPYGWGWLLRLAAELALWDDDRAERWHRTLKPLEETIVELVEGTFLTQDRPFRVGTHRNSAFALACVLDYARVVNADALAERTAQTALDFYADDRDYPIHIEPLAWDFCSPALLEADLMRRVLPPDEFEDWFVGFLPLESAEAREVISQPHEFDAENADGGELHLTGLNLSKAWCLAGIAAALEPDETAEVLWEAAERHAAVGLDQAFTEDYAGSHWLVSFVLYLLTRNDGGIAPALT